MGNLDGKTAIITGAASGQGEASARTMAERGASVVLADINVAGAEQNASQINDNGGSAVAVAVDVRVEADIERMVSLAVERFGRLDILHNNAADLHVLFDPGDPDITQFTVPNWQNQFETLVLGPMLGCKHAIPRMIETGGGSIISTSSISGMIGELSLTVYGAAKSAVTQVTRSVSAQWGKEGIRCNDVAPGLVLSPPGLELGQELIDQYTRHCDTTYVGRPQDLANVVAFLASDESRYITGQSIRVDGGFSMHSPMNVEARSSGLLAG